MVTFPGEKQLSLVRCLYKGRSRQTQLVATKFSQFSPILPILPHLPKKRGQLPLFSDSSGDEVQILTSCNPIAYASGSTRP